MRVKKTDEDEESDEAPAKCIGRLGTKMVGKIGREVITRCKSFGMKIIGYDP